MLSERIASALTRRTASESAGPQRSGRSSAIFGSSISVQGGGASQQARRLAVYPAMTNAFSGEAAAGLSLLLGLLVESFGDVDIYPVLARIDEELTTWNKSQVSLQFSPDDWSLEGIEEDAAVWSVLERVGQGWRWSVSMEDDLSSSEEPFIQTQEAASLAELVAGMGAVARELVGSLQGTERTLPAIMEWPDSDSEITELLTLLGAWYLACMELILTDNGSPSAAEQSLTKATQHADSPGVTWAAASAWVFGMTWIAAGQSLASALDPESFVLSLPQIAYGVVPVSRLFLQAGAPDIARRLLLRATEEEPEYWPTWLMLGQLYISAGRGELAVDTFHRALENGAEHPRLLMAYANVLQTYRKQGLVLRQVILIEDPEPDAGRVLLRELIQAYKEAAELAPFLKAQCLSESLPVWMELGETDDLSVCLRELAEVDVTGEWLNAGLQDILAMDDLLPVLSTLEVATRQFSDRYGVWRAYAVALNAHGDRRGTSAAANAALKLTQSASERGEMEFLALVGQNPKVESFMAEVLQDMGTDAEIADDTFETLEMIVEQAPHYAEAQLALAAIYRLTDEDEAALEVLLEAEGRLPGSPEVVLALGELLRDLDELATAIDYVRKGLESSPDSVPLLALAAELILDVGDEESALAMLARAQAISGFHPDVQRAARRFMDDGE